MKKYRAFAGFYLLSLMLCTVISTAQAQTTAFNFQGRLNDGSSPANGHYDLQFRLYDALTGDNQIGSAITKSNTTLINGVFSTQLDFGANAFNGADRFIEIRLRSTGTENGYVILGPRQQILSVPYSIRSLRSTLADDAAHAANADNAINAQNAVNATNSVNATNAVTADNAKMLGGKSVSEFLHVNNYGQFDFGGSSVVQQFGSDGLPKAILRFDRDGIIKRCYNVTTGFSSGNCGFSVNHDGLGSYVVSLGFSLQNSVFSITTDYDEGETIGLIYLRQGNGVLNITVHYFVSRDFTNAPVNLVVY